MYYITPRGLIPLFCINEVNWVHPQPGSWVCLWMVFIFPSSTWREHRNPGRTGGSEPASQHADTPAGGTSVVSREVTRCNWPQRNCEYLRGKAASDNGCSGVTKVRAACYMIALTAHVREYFGAHAAETISEHTHTKTTPQYGYFTSRTAKTSASASGRWIWSRFVAWDLQDKM